MDHLAWIPRGDIKVKLSANSTMLPHAQYYSEMTVNEDGRPHGDLRAGFTVGSTASQGHGEVERLTMGRQLCMAQPASIGNAVAVENDLG
jgi:hypothetical protein